jgi:hypothetical protein
MAATQTCLLSFHRCLRVEGGQAVNGEGERGADAWVLFHVSHVFTHIKSTTDVG